MKVLATCSMALLGTAAHARTICTEQYDPKCDANGTIYGNACKAGLAGERTLTDHTEPEMCPVMDLLPSCTKWISTQKCNECPTLECVEFCQEKELGVWFCIAPRPDTCDDNYDWVPVSSPACPRCAYECVEKRDVCPMHFDPVCDKDGNQYDNKCKANLEGVTEFACCKATKVLQSCRPVKCKSGYTEKNTTRLDQDGCEKCVEIQCVNDDDDQCDRRDPVCDTTGTKYPSECLANQAGVESFTTCPINDRFCTKEYKPVCDAYGVQFSNACMAKLQGVEEPVRCPPKEGNCDEVCIALHCPFGHIRKVTARPQTKGKCRPCPIQSCEKPQCEVRCMALAEPDPKDCNGTWSKIDQYSSTTGCVGCPVYRCIKERTVTKCPPINDCSTKAEKECVAGKKPVPLMPLLSTVDSCPLECPPTRECVDESSPEAADAATVYKALDSGNATASYKSLAQSSVSSQIYVDPSGNSATAIAASGITLALLVVHIL